MATVLLPSLRLAAADVLLGPDGETCPVPGEGDLAENAACGVGKIC